MLKTSINSSETSTEAVGVFHTAAALQAAADALLVAGFDRAHLNLLAGEKAVEAKLGHAWGTVYELEDDPDAATQPYSTGDSRTEAMTLAVSGLFYVGAVAASGVVVASGGAVAAIILAALAGGSAGGAIGGVLASFLSHHHADALQHQINKGGLLLWVRTIDKDHEERALEILMAQGADDVHLHDLPTLKASPDDGEIYGYLDWLSGESRSDHAKA